MLYHWATMADVILLSILLYLYMIWGYTKMGLHQIKAPSAGQSSHGFAIEYRVVVIVKMNENVLLAKIRLET